MTAKRTNDPQRPWWAAGNADERGAVPKKQVAPHVALPHKGPRKDRRSQAMRDRNDER